MKAKPGDVHVFRLHRDVQKLQDAEAFSGIFGSDPARFSRQMEIFEAFVAEASDHFLR
jgi:hypothetical protein